MKEEILDIVNEKDEIVGNATYDEIHKEKLLHHVAIGFLVNDADEVLLSLRSSTKTAHPSTWSFSMGGHVRHGEDYLQAIVREGKEEIGVTFPKDTFVVKGKGVMKEQSGAEVLYQMYQVRYDGPIEEKTDEVDAVQFVTWPDLKKMINEGKEKMHPQMVVGLQRHFAKELGL